MKKTYIITGCAGFIGFHLCQTLLRKKFHIIGIDKISNYYSIKLKKDRLHILKKNKNFHFLKKDINNHSFNTILREKVRKKKIIAIIHLAAQAGVRNSLTKPFDYIYDNHFSELKDTELWQERLNLLAQAEPYIGKYYSQETIRSKILRQTDGEMEEEDKKIEKEIADGIIPDPSTLDPVTGEPLPAMEDGDPAGAIADMAGAIDGQAGTVPTDPPDMPKKGMGEF